MTDTDNDGICDSLDNCPATANGTQEDIDSDGIGDMCDTENLISCEDVYIVTLTYANGDVLTYRAADHIVAYNQIQSGAQIVYDAGEYIDLMNGFTANEGADFTALISGCVGVAKNEDNTDNTENIVEINKLEEDNNINFVAYPNPAADKLNIAFKVDTDVRTNISLYNMQGQQLQQIFNQKVPANSPQNISLELGEIPSGVYILQLSTTDGESKYIKVAVQR
ncbi:MAG: T9SS type A sorting domain-containing protein [Bacteroidetes bacterium]|nr:T9SS type A sorting domain-containing protein [Bacteroidota bacterium]